MRRRGRAIGVLAVVVAGVVLVLAFAGRLLVVEDALPERADAIVVLAGSPAARTMEAAAIYAKGIAGRVILTRERRPPAELALARRGIATPQPHEEARRYLVALGVPPEAILVLHGRAHSTDSEARLIAAWACREGHRALVLVTSPSHTRRARAIVRRALGPDVTVAVRPAREDFFPEHGWWQHRPAAKLVLSEYQKLAHYWLRERWRLGACGRS
jgi:uncharacterized SAM-binding protein YcdF (DUF218 family)